MTLATSRSDSPFSFAPSSAAYTALEVRSRSTVSMARPNADEICSRLAMRLMSAEWFEPAAWNSAGLKKTASPLASGSWMWWVVKYSWKSGRR